MARGTDAARRHADFARIGLGIVDELGNRRGWNRWIDHHDIRGAANARDRRYVADEIEIELIVERRVHRVRQPDAYPSGVALTTLSVPILPPAPVRFSMTNGWASRSDNC